MKKPKLRQIKINDRVLYALDKKSLRELGWESRDMVSQHTDTNIPYAISLFNKTHWERASKGKKGPIDLAVEQAEKRDQDFKKIEKRYGKKEKANRRRKRALNKFNKGKISEKDIKKEQIRFIKSSTNSQIKKLEKAKREIKKNNKKFVSLIQNNPGEAIKRVGNLSTKRLENIDEEIKKSEQNLKEALKILKKRPITSKPIQNDKK